MITGCNILPAPLPCPVYSGLQHQHFPLIAMSEIIPMGRKRQGNNDSEWNGTKKRRVTEKERVGRGDREQPGNLAAVCRVSGEWHFSMWLAYGANCGNSAGRPGGGNQWRSGWLWQPSHRKGKAAGAEGWYRCQSLAKSAICHGELAKSHRPRHVAKVVGDLRWPVIMSWKLSFQHGRFPTAANHAVV